MNTLEKWVIAAVLSFIGIVVVLNKTTNNEPTIVITSAPSATQTIEVTSSVIAKSTATPELIFAWEEDSTEKLVWNLLREEFSEQATAAIMGNLKYESGICPFRIGGLSIEQSYDISEKIKDNEQKFVYETEAYGLAMWHGPYNKQKLWNFCQEHGYSVDSVEGQVAYLIHDLKTSAPMCYERLQLYDLEDLMYATEDFRESYEYSTLDSYSQYMRCKYAKWIFDTHCENIEDIEVVALIPYNFENQMRVNELNKLIEEGKLNETN